MNFGDKLTQIRKRNGLSQEELGDKLNVTRQTISKWELGQSKPDTDKLMEISKLLNVDFNLLIDDSLSLDNNNISNTSNVVIEDEVRPRKWLLIVLIVVAIGLVIFLLDGYVKNRKTEAEKMKDEVSSFFDIFTGFGESIMGSDFDASFENQVYEHYSGTESGNRVESLLDHIITNNKKNKNNAITVIFEGINSSEPNEIKNIKRNLDSFSEYEVSFEYDKKGYIYEATIEKIEDSKNNIDNFFDSSNNEEIDNNDKEEEVSQFEIKSFNSKYEIHNGTQFGVSITMLLDKVITDNKTKKDHIIKVVYKSTNTTDETEIRNLKKNIDDFTKYEIILDYDEAGYVNQITIEN